MKKTVSITFLIFLLATSTLSSQNVPGKLSYQGILMQNDGITPLSDGSHSIEFNFYNALSGGSLLAGVGSRTIVVNTAKGLFTCVIGDGAPGNAALPASIGSQPTFIGIKVDGGIELSPRVQLTTPAYAWQAQTAYTVSDDAVTTAKIGTAGATDANKVLTTDASGNPQWELKTAVGITGSGTSGNIPFWTGASSVGNDGNLFWDNSVNKRLGIGSIAPDARLHVLGDGSIAGDDDIIAESRGTTQASFQLRRARGSKSAPAAALSNDALGTINFLGYNGSSYSVGAGIRSLTESDFNSSVNANLVFRTASNGTESERMRIESSGQVGIANNNPFYTLDVSGQVTSRASDAFRARNSTYSAFFRNDNTDFYLMQTASGDPDGNWNSYRPFRLNLATGNVFVNQITALQNGNVGIGIASPQTTLHVGGVARFESNDQMIQIVGATHAYMGFYPDGLGAGRKGYFGYGGSSDNNLTIANEIPSADIILTSNGGNVGVSNASPSHKLDIYGGSIRVAADVAPSLNLQDNGSGSSYRNYRLNNDDGLFRIQYTSFVSGLPPTYDRISIDLDGDVGIGTTNPTAKLHLVQTTDAAGIRFSPEDGGTAWVLGAANSNNFWFNYGSSNVSYINDQNGSYNQSSDLRLKDDVKSLESVLPKLIKLNPSSYYFKNDSKRTKRSIGLVAQDVASLFPELVSLDDRGYYSISYAEFGVLAIQGIKELKEVVQQQQTQIEDLKSANQELERRLAVIEAMLTKSNTHPTSASSKAEK